MSYVLRLCGSGAYEYIPPQETRLSLRRLSNHFSGTVDSYTPAMLKIEYHGKNVSIFPNGQMLLYDRTKEEAEHDCNKLLEEIIGEEHND